MGSKGKKKATAAAAKPSSIKLAIILGCWIRAPEKFVAGDFDGEKMNAPIVDHLGEGFPPIWEEDPAREDAQGKTYRWAEIWDEEEFKTVQRALKKAGTAFFAVKPKRPADFRWKDNEDVTGTELEMLESFQVHAEEEKWHLALDTPIDDYMTDQHITVKDIFDADDEGVGNDIPGIDSWAPHLGPMAMMLFGWVANWSKKLPDKFAYLMRALITLRLDAIRSLTKRAMSANRRRTNEIEKALGKNFLFKQTVPRGLTTRALTAAHKKMQEYRETLVWTHISPEQQAVMEEEIDLEDENAYDQIHKRWTNLPDDVKYREICLTSIGWMAVLILRRSGRDVLADIEFDETSALLVARGKFLAGMVKEQAVNEMAEMSNADTDGFRNEVKAYVVEVTRRETPVDLRALQAMLANREPDVILRDILSTEGDSIGIEGYRQFDVGQLSHLLGYTGPRPFGFREWYCKEKLAACMADHGKRCPHAEDIRLFWHQLCCLARIFENVFQGSRGDIPGLLNGGPANQAARAPIALQEGWSNLPGMLLALDVGMGKTVTVLAKIATYAALVDAQHASPNGTGIGVIGDSQFHLPSAGHVIVVPAGLMAQWKEEIFRYIIPGYFSVYEVRRTKTHWANDLKAFEESPQVPHRKILLISHTSLKRMWTDNPGHKSGGHSVVNWTARGTIWRMSFGTGSNDEVHVGRGETTTTDSFDALWALTLVKSGLTGTPLMQGANDLRSMARLCRPPIFTELEMMSFNSQEQDLKRLKRQYGIKLEDVAANPTKMNELTKSVAGSVSMVHSKIMVAQARKYIIPYTLRVTKHTKNNEGKLVTQGLPDNTSLIVGMEVSQEEFHAADTEFHKSHAGESTKSKNTGLEGMSASRFGTFFAAGRKVLNAGLFLGLQESSYIPTSQEDFIRLRATKMRTLLDVVHGMVTKEPGNAIPATREVVDKDGNTHTEPLHGSQHCIVDLTELGLIPAHTEQWVPPPTVSFAEMKKAGKRIPKVVVYLAMAQYHPAVVAMFNMWGIKAISMSGAFAPARRATIQKEWEAKEDLSVLIISDAGTQGLNLVAADGMVLQDIPWSENEVIQIIARLWRHGQKRPTFVVRLMVKGTVEHMMVANGTAKRDMLEKFLDGKASPHLIRALKGSGTEDDDDLILGDMEVSKEEKEEHENAVAPKARKTRKKPPPKSKTVVASDDESERGTSQQPIEIDSGDDKAKAAKPRPKRAPAKKATKVVTNIAPPKRVELPGLESEDEPDAPLPPPQAKDIEPPTQRMDSPPPPTPPAHVERDVPIAPVPPPDAHAPGDDDRDIEMEKTNADIPDTDGVLSKSLSTRPSPIQDSDASHPAQREQDKTDENPVVMPPPSQPVPVVMPPPSHATPIAMSPPSQRPGPPDAVSRRNDSDMSQSDSDDAEGKGPLDPSTQKQPSAPATPARGNSPDSHAMDVDNSAADLDPDVFGGPDDNLTDPPDERPKRPLSSPEAVPRSKRAKGKQPARGRSPVTQPVAGPSRSSRVTSSSRRRDVRVTDSPSPERGPDPDLSNFPRAPERAKPSRARKSRR